MPTASARRAASTKRATRSPQPRAIHAPDPKSKRSKRRIVLAEREAYRTAKVDAYLGAATDCAEYVLASAMRAAWARDSDGFPLDVAFAEVRATNAVEKTALLALRRTLTGTAHALVYSSASTVEGLQRARLATRQWRALRERVASSAMFGTTAQQRAAHKRLVEAAARALDEALDLYRAVRRRPPRDVLAAAGRKWQSPRVWTGEGEPDPCAGLTVREPKRRTRKAEAERVALEGLSPARAARLVLGGATGSR